MSRPRKVAASKGMSDVRGLNDRANDALSFRPGRTRDGWTQQR